MPEFVPKPKSNLTATREVAADLASHEEALRDLAKKLKTNPDDHDAVRLALKHVEAMGSLFDVGEDEEKDIKEKLCDWLGDIFPAMDQFEINEIIYKRVFRDGELVGTLNLTLEHGCSQRSVPAFLKINETGTLAVDGLSVSEFENGLVCNGTLDVIVYSDLGDLRGVKMGESASLKIDRDNVVVDIPLFLPVSPVWKDLQIAMTRTEDHIELPKSVRKLTGKLHLSSMGMSLHEKKFVVHGDLFVHDAEIKFCDSLQFDGFFESDVTVIENVKDLKFGSYVKAKKIRISHSGGLENIDIPDDQTQIDEMALQNLSGLKCVYVRGKVKELVLEQVTFSSFSNDAMVVDVGDLSLFHVKGFSFWPEMLRGKNILIKDCPDLNNLPSDWTVPGDLSLKELNIENMPETLVVGGTLTLDSNDKLEQWSSTRTGTVNLTVGGDLRLVGQKNLKQLTGLFNRGNIMINGDVYIYRDYQPSLLKNLQKLKKQGKIKGEIKVASNAVVI